MNKSAFGGSKDLLFEGKDLDLKFLEDCRCHLKFDKTKSEYTFTDAQRCWIRNSNRLKPQDFLKDKLVFAIKGANSFWDDFINIDKTVGESMKQTFRNSPSSSLPKSLPLPITPKSSSNNKKLMEEIKRSLSGVIVTTTQIAESFLKMIGSSYSGRQVRDLAVRLEKENGRSSGSCLCSVPRDKLEQIDCKCLEEYYKKATLNSSTINDLEKGIYKVSTLDKIIFSVSKDLFWSRIYNHSDDKKINEEARKGVGLTMDKLEGDKIFVATKLGLDKINVQKTQYAIGSLSDDIMKKIKYIGIYANYLSQSMDIKQIWITSAERDAELQALLVYKSVSEATNQLASNSMYKGPAGLYVQEELKKSTSKEVIVSNLSVGILNGIKSETNLKPRYIGFNHVSNNTRTIDIGANSGLDPNKSSFRNSLKKFISVGVILDSRSIEEGDKGEKDCHHLVFK